jgi:NAD(P)-dependent dehydrogenase (short-subunit alcohol dehydrogenase family)
MNANDKTVIITGGARGIGKALALAFKHKGARSLSITHGNDGIRVSVVCPQYVATPMLGYCEGEGEGEGEG